MLFCGFYRAWREEATACYSRAGLSGSFRGHSGHVFLQLACCFLCCFCVSCLSLNFNLPEDKKAKGVVFQPPPAPYGEVSREGMDSAYENSRNKNIIAFFSNCSSSASFSNLEEFQKDLLGGLKSFRIKNQTETLKENQKARYLHLQKSQTDKQKSQTDKQKSQMRLFIFKKGMCFYALSFLNRAGGGNEKVFSDFIRGFKAP